KLWGSWADKRLRAASRREKSRSQKVNVYEEEVIMFAPVSAETIGLKQCHVCAAEQLDRDNFCRRCGVSQNSRVDPSTTVAGGITGSVTSNVTEIANSSGCGTRPLSRSATLRRSYSGPVLGIVTQDLSERTSSIRANRWAMRMVIAMFAAPLWMVIVLLSPL